MQASGNNQAAASLEAFLPLSLHPGMTRQRFRTIIIHAIFWSVFLSIPTVFNTRRMGQGPSKFVFDLLEPPRLINALFLIAVFYFNTAIAIPRFYFRKKYILLGLSLVLSTSLFFLINYSMAPEGIRASPGFTPLGNSFNLFMFIIVYAFSFIICLYRQYQREKEDQLNTRISFLTAQINPHFLFNTLNSIHSLSLVRSAHVSDAIVKLAAIMRYSIDEGSQDKVTLGKEINYIRDYIELQKLRLTDEVKVQVMENIEAPGLWIAPFLLIPFVENAFKHGINGEADSEIDIQINADAHSVSLLVRNDIVPTRERAKGTGLGITTTQQRLHLLYPNRHQLNIDRSDHKFTVQLRVALT